MHASNVSRGRQIVVRFLALAEERLAYLTELYETGRWSRYFTQAELLANVREAKAAVDAWTLLAAPSQPSNRPSPLDWLDNARPLPPRKPLMPHVEQPRAAARPVVVVQNIVASHPAAAIRVDGCDGLAPIRLDDPVPMPVPLPVAVTAASEALATPKLPPWQNALDFALMRERYPLLRRAG